MTDSRAYAHLSDAGVLRFSPRGQSHVADADRMHGTDERLSVADYRGSLCTTRRLMHLLGGFGAAEGGQAGDGGSGSGAGDSKDEL